MKIFKISRFKSTLTKLCAIALLGVVGVSCSDDDKPKGEPSFEIEGFVSELTATYEGIKDKKFVVRSNRDWVVNKTEGADWIKIFPQDGGMEDGIFKINVVQNNATSTREGFVKFFVHGEEQMHIIRIFQEGRPAYMVAALPNFKTDHTQKTAKFELETNVAWTASLNAEAQVWASLGQKGSTSDVKQYIEINVAENTNMLRRRGKLTISFPANPELTATYNMTQLFEGDEDIVIGLPAEWNLLGATMGEYAANFDGDGMFIMANVQNPAAKLEYVLGGVYNRTSITHSVGSTGQPYVTGAWKEDYWQFTIPVDGVDAESVIAVLFTNRSTGAGPMYWILEYYDEGTWKPEKTLETAIELGSDGQPILYTRKMTNGGHDEIKANLVFMDPIDNGNLLIRFRCASELQVNGTMPTTPSTSGTNRISGGTNGPNPLFKLL